MASKRELQALIVLAGKVDPSLQKALKQAESKTKSLDKTTNLFRQTAEKAWSAVKTGVAVGMASIGAAMVYVGKQGLALASDLTEVQNVVDVTFGEQADLINNFAKNAKRDFGLSELAAKQFAGTMGAMFKSMGVAEQYIADMSTTITGLSADFASFYNLDPAEAFEKIRSGISGETEPLKALGINMSVANLEAYALAQGITTAYSKMSAADQAILRFNYLLSVSADAQGDFNRNIDSFANQSRILKTNFQELAAKIMSGAIPAFEKLMQKGNELMESFMDDPEKMQKLQDTIAKVFDSIISAIPVAISGAQAFIGMIWGIFSVGYKVFNFIKTNWGTIAPLILGIVSAMTAWKAITLGMVIYQGIMAGIRAGTIAATIAQWGLNAAVLANPMTWIITGIAAAVGVLVAAFYALYKNWDSVQTFLVNTWTSVKKAFATGINWIVDKLNWLIEKINKIPGVEIPLIPKIGENTQEAAIRSTEKVEQFAKGGIATRPSIFGEDGPEMAIPLKKTPRSLGLLNQTARMLGVNNGGSEGGSGITFVYAPNYGPGTTETQVRGDFEAFKAMFEKWWEERRREEFA